MKCIDLNVLKGEKNCLYVVIISIILEAKLIAKQRDCHGIGTVLGALEVPAIDVSSLISSLLVPSSEARC